MRPLHATQSGFTLAETMVALFILALVSSAGATLLIGATSAGQQMRQQETEARQIDIAQRLIRQDIAAMSDRAVQPNDGFSPPSNLFGEAPNGEAPFLEFVRGGWINPGQIEPRSSLQAVTYALRNGDLVRDVRLRPDATNGTPISSRVLLEDVKTVQLGFVRGGQRSEYWQGNALRGRGIFPDLIELEIVFENDASLSIAALTGARG